MRGENLRAHPESEGGALRPEAPGPQAGGGGPGPGVSAAHPGSGLSPLLPGPSSASGRTSPVDTAGRAQGQEHRPLPAPRRRRLPEREEGRKPGPKPGLGARNPFLPTQRSSPLESAGARAGCWRSRNILIGAHSNALCHIKCRESEQTPQIEIVFKLAVRPTLEFCAARGPRGGGARRAPAASERGFRGVVTQKRTSPGRSRPRAVRRRGPRSRGHQDVQALPQPRSLQVQRGGTWAGRPGVSVRHGRGPVARPAA